MFWFSMLLVITNGVCFSAVFALHVCVDNIHFGISTFWENAVHLVNRMCFIMFM